MEKWNTYQKVKVHIELIDCFIGGNQELKVYFTEKEKKKWILYFDGVFDFRYAVENAFIDRWYTNVNHEVIPPFHKV